jgi:hypothetical protein
MIREGQVALRSRGVGTRHFGVLKSKGARRIREIPSCDGSHVEIGVEDRTRGITHRHSAFGVSKHKPFICDTFPE